MSPRQIRTHVDALSHEFRREVTALHTAKRLPEGFPSDYIENHGWTDAFERLIDMEKAHERKHQGYRPASVPRSRVSVDTAARVLVLHNIAAHADPADDPDGIHRQRLALTAADVFHFRDSAYLACVLGSLLRGLLSPQWIAAAQQLDYAAIMAIGRGE